MVVEQKKQTTCEQCGGCLGLTEPYTKHIQKKQEQLESIVGKFGKIESLIPMEDAKYYRNRVFSVFHHDKKGPVCGVFNAEQRKIISLDDCDINSKKATEIIKSIRNLLKSFKIKTYDPKTGHGLLRYVLIRESKNTGEIMVVLVLSSHIMPSKNNFVKALRKEHPEIDTVVINENYKVTEKLLGDKETAIFGKGFIFDSILGKMIRVGTKTTHPVNTIQTENVCKKVIEYAGFTKADLVLDVYCGTGILSVISSDLVRKVIGVDGKPEQIKDAVSNVRKNKIKNVDFYTNDPATFIMQIVESEKEKPNIVLLDPPKGKTSKELLAALGQLKAKTIIYISKNPYHLAEDLEYFSGKGYKVNKMIGIDTLPWTTHIECICLLSKYK